MKNLRQILFVTLLFMSFLSFSQSEDTKQAKDSTTTKEDNSKLTYSKTKELFLRVLDSLKKDNSETLGKFTINKSPVPIEEDSLEGISKNESKILNDLLVVNNLSKSNNEERKIIVNEYYKNKIESLEKFKLEIVKTINLDTLENEDSSNKRRKLFKEIDSLSKKIDFIKKNGDNVFNNNFKSNETSQNLLKSFLKRKEIWVVDNVEIEIKEGFITDVLVTLIEKTDSELKNQRKRFFTNKFPTSLAVYGNYKKNPLKEKGGNNKAIIQLFDVLDYQHNMGKNYAPNDRTVKISRKEGFKEITLDNNLDSFLDFRIYSDFLGLINETPNGIINFETSSKITLNPRNYSNVYFFKSVTPFLKYSRFDNDDRKALLDTINYKSIVRRLDLEQKAFISAGAKFDLLEFKFSKESPFLIQIPFSFRMNIVELDKPDVEENNSFTVNTLVYGSGINADFKKINNFGLKLGVLVEGYDQKGNSDEIKRTPVFYTLGMSSELYYYDSNNSSSAFFLRLRTNRVLGSGENYVALQFGYKSSLNFSSKNKK